ncbi:MAG: acyl-CoA dehydrogenase domain-containing protein, partial [Candidatus Marinamargulisbacteria bacterium]
PLKPFITWALHYCFYNMQHALMGYLENMSWVTRRLIAPIFRLLPVSVYPGDQLGRHMAVAIQKDPKLRTFFSDGAHIGTNTDRGLAKLNHAYEHIIMAEPSLNKIRRAIKKRQLSKQPILNILDDAIKNSIISATEAEHIRRAEALRMDAIQVDSFPVH